MILLLLMSLIYVVLTFIASNLLNYLSVPLLLVFLYIIPLLINLVIYKIQNKDWKVFTVIAAPTLSISFYMFFAYFTSSTGLWEDFVLKNTVSDANMSLEITKNLFASSQILFIIVLFYGGSLTYHFISQKVLNKGV